MDRPSFQTRDFQSPDLLPKESPPAKKTTPGKPPKKMRILSCFFIALIIILSSCTALISRSNNNFFVGIKNGFLVRQLKHIFAGAENELKGEAEDRINFLILGIGGPGHDGPYLSDTIILGSFKPSNTQAAMLSIPRDLIIPDGAGRYVKINHIYALDQKNGLEQAFLKTKELIGNAFDLPIHYLGVIDFQGFVETIDTVGGIRVEVDRAFSDYQFPAGPNQYQVVSFDAGHQKMNGLTALRYARSRHGNNGEGSDFARSQRQQKIILSTRDKMASFSTIFNPKKITTLFSLINQYTKTDIEPWEMVKMVQLSKDITGSDIFTYVLDDSPGGYLFSGISSVDGAYILQPRTGDFQQLQILASNMLDDNRFKGEGPSIVVQNGTTIPNLASTIESELANFGVRPLAIGNADRPVFTNTVLYDYTDGKKSRTRDFLESRFKIKAQTIIPLEILSYNVAKNLDITDADGNYAELDFLLILGEDADSNGRSEIIRTLTIEELQATSTATTSEELIEMTG
jgi:polyisoprenyl-teichoic acid--peptidoglycan teichoic acid transferase